MEDMNRGEGRGVYRVREEELGSVAPCRVAFRLFCWDLPDL
jgi:hypothetical protein